MASEELGTRWPQLGSREREVLRARFGFDAPEQTLREVGVGLGVSAERVRQIEQHALEKLRSAPDESPPRRRSRRRVLVPAVDVCASRDEQLLQIDLPGVCRDALRVRLRGNLLIVCGSRPAPPPAPGWKRERHFGAFERVLRVPSGLDPRAIQTDLTDGVLTVRIAVDTARGCSAACGQAR